MYVYDNGLTFVSGSEAINRLWQDSMVNNYLGNINVQWKCIPKRAPWFGGFYERLAGITKSVLKKSQGRSLVRLDELNILIIE